MSYAFGDPVLVVPEHGDETEVYPGGIQPGRYYLVQLVDLLREHAHNPEAIRFIADMMEE